jgi:hypothetical protein
LGRVNTILMSQKDELMARAYFKVEGDPNVMRMKAEMVLAGILEGSKEDAQHVIEMHKMAFPEPIPKSEQEINERIRAALSDEAAQRYFDNIEMDYSLMSQTVNGYLRWKDEFRREVVFVAHKDGPLTFYKRHLPNVGSSFFIAPEP